MLGLEHVIAFMFIMASVLIGANASPLYYEDNNFDRQFMPFGKRAVNDLYGLEDGQFNRAFMPFGKRDASSWEQAVDKKNFNREFMHFGRRR